MDSNFYKKYNIDRLLSSIPIAKRKQLLYDNEAISSITSYNLSVKISKVLQDLPNITKESTIIDATASIGGNTFTFSVFFKKVLAIEINKNRYDMLRHNVHILKLDNVKTLHSSCLRYFDTHKRLYDIVFFDPPWGGVDYKSKKNISLFIDNTNLVDICKNVSKKSKIKYIVIKAPNNVNLREYTSIFKNMKIIKSLKKFIIMIIFLES